MNPPPGSKEALDRGCTCPVLDNGHGKANPSRLVYVQGCPVHDCPSCKGTGITEQPPGWRVCQECK